MGQCCCAQSAQASEPSPKKPVSKRRQRRAQRFANAATAKPQNGSITGHANGHAATSNGQSEFRQESEADDWCSCRDDFSVTDGSHLGSQAVSPGASGRVTPSHVGQSQAARGATSGHMTPSQQQEQRSANHTQQQEDGEESPLDQSVQGASESDSEVGQANGTGPFGGCLAILDGLTIGGASARHPESGARQPEGTHQTPATQSRRQPGEKGEKAEAGCSMQPRDKSISALEVSFCYEDASHSPFNIRSQDYMKTKVKQKSSTAMYQLAAADIFALPKKQGHIAKVLQLPPHGPPIMAGDVALPPLLIFNLQLPLYLATLFGAQDGEGVSILFYFRLPEDFDPATFENQAALNLYKRFVTNGREADGSPTRDRLKLIPRVCNVEEWVRTGPLSMTEHKMLINYNDKPILSRPQHHFHTGRGYLEVDLDLHKYTFLARRAITSYLQRLPQVVWENAFVVQGNAADELPEHLLGVARIYRFDFKAAKTLSEFMPGPRSLPPADDEQPQQSTPPSR